MNSQLLKPRMRMTAWRRWEKGRRSEKQVINQRVGHRVAFDLWITTLLSENDRMKTFQILNDFQSTILWPNGEIKVHFNSGNNLKNWSSFVFRQQFYWMLINQIELGNKEKTWGIGNRWPNSRAKRHIFQRWYWKKT